MSAPNGTNGHSASSLTNYCAFVDPARGIERIGHLDESSQTVQPLAFKSGTYLSNLYQVIQVGEDGIIPSGEPVPRSSIQLLPPINGRDILCVGKNYSEHAKEFNKSGFDSSDKVDQPTHPVIPEHAPDLAEHLHHVLHVGVRRWLEAELRVDALRPALAAGITVLPNATAADVRCLVLHAGRP